ncbi:hypothetical protein KEM56_004945, partial [Ascosphaera pollenicola]
MAFNQQPPLSYDPPKSYATLPTQDIKISHVPESAPEATATIVVTLNRPTKLNAFTVTMGFELIQAFTYFKYDDRVKCIVLTGTGNKAFCAGMDLGMGFPTGKEERESEHRDL